MTEPLSPSPDPTPPPLLVGMAGGTASGKTTLARVLARLDPQVLLIGHDRYYHTVPHPETHNYDEPAALDSALLLRHLAALVQGGTAEIPRYDYRHHRRQPQGQWVAPRQVILVEGILVLAEPALRDRFHLKVWVEAPGDIRLLRRVRRDAVERGRSVAEVLTRYERTVRPSHLRWVAPCAEHADLVLDGTADVDAEVDRLRRAIRAARGGSPPTPGALSA